MTHYRLFDQLTASYPAESIWTVGRGEPLEWWEICQHALESTQRASGGDVMGSASEQERYWRVAYEALETVEGMMVSCEMVNTNS